MNWYKLLLVVACFSLASCQSIMFTLYGIKKPKVENQQSLQKKAHKFGLDTGNIVTVTSADFLNTIRGQGIPNAAIYDKKGRYVEYRHNDSACNAGLFDFIPNLRVGNNYHYPDTPNLTNTLSKYRTLNGEPLQAPVAEADFYVLIYWTVWTGRLNKDHVKIWEELAHKNTHCKVQVIKVNLDIQEYWDAPIRQTLLNAMRNPKK